MTASSLRAPLRRSARLAIAAGAILAAAHGASAGDDAGVHQFLTAIFGVQPAPEPVTAPPEEAAPVRPRPHRLRARPLTVRLRPAKPRIVVARAPTKPATVSIFEDRTLRRGDAVMTARGLRVFAGSNAWPYSAGDFVSLDDARQFSRDMTKVLAQLDRVPRG